MDTFTQLELTESELTDAVLTGAPVYGPGDEKVGSVAGVHGTGLDAHAVVDVGGFLGIGAKPVAIPVADLNFMRNDEGTVYGTTFWTKDQLKDLPIHEDAYETYAEPLVDPLLPPRTIF